MFIDRMRNLSTSAKGCQFVILFVFFLWALKMHYLKMRDLKLTDQIAFGTYRLMTKLNTVLNIVLA